VVYPARREPILVWVLAFDGVITLGVASWMIWEAAVKHWSPAFFAVGPGLLFSFLAACWMLLHSNYEIAGQDLIVRQGPARRTISIAISVCARAPRSVLHRKHQRVSSRPKLMSGLHWMTSSAVAK